MTAKIVNSLPASLTAPTQRLLGLKALAAELAAQGVSVDEMLDRTGVHPWQIEDPHSRISHRQRLSIYRNARRLAKVSDIGLRAGARQRVTDFGMLGYAMLSSRTFGEALEFALDHVAMACPVAMQISFRIENGTAVLRNHGVQSLGDLLPFGAELWLSSMTSLFYKVLEAPFPSKRMIFTFSRPAHWRNYELVFNCPIEFDASLMEWHFDADVLNRPCPNANPITAQASQEFCDRMLADIPAESDLARQIREACLSSSNRFPPAEEIAGQLGLSLRTLHRRLANEGMSYQSLLDSVRRTVAFEFLESGRLSIDQIAERVGFADATSFRKAFRKWTGHSPTHYRRENRTKRLQDDSIVQVSTENEHPPKTGLQTESPAGCVQRPRYCLAITGWSGSGKTKLICELLPHLVKLGFSVSTVKQAHKEFDIDHPGKDSFAHRKAGAREVMVTSSVRWALMHENVTEEDEMDLDASLDRMSNVDLVLVEGFKTSHIPTIEVYRAALGKPPLRGERENVIAIVSDDWTKDGKIPIFSPSDTEALAKKIISLADKAGSHN